MLIWVFLCATPYNNNQCWQLAKKTNKIWMMVASWNNVCIKILTYKLLNFLQWIGKSFGKTTDWHINIVIIWFKYENPIQGIKEDCSACTFFHLSKLLLLCDTLTFCVLKNQVVFRRGGGRASCCYCQAVLMSDAVAVPVSRWTMDIRDGGPRVAIANMEYASDGWMMVGQS